MSTPPVYLFYLGCRLFKSLVVLWDWFSYFWFRVSIIFQSEKDLKSRETLKDATFFIHSMILELYTFVQDCCIMHWGCAHSWIFFDFSLWCCFIFTWWQLLVGRKTLSINILTSMFAVALVADKNQRIDRCKARLTELVQSGRKTPPRIRQLQKLTRWITRLSWQYCKARRTCLMQQQASCSL